MYTLKGRTAVITGATDHMGAGAVHMLTEARMNVAMVTHNMEDVRWPIAEIEHHPGTCITLNDENGDGTVYGEVCQRFGSVDMIIPNQDMPARLKGFSDITEQGLDQKLHHQVISSFTMMQKALPYLARSRADHVILMAGINAESGVQEEGLPDCAARGGVISMTRYLTQAPAGQGIAINCIAKGGMENDHPVKWEGELDNKTPIPRIPAGHNGTPRDFGTAVCYLASKEAGSVTGQVLRLNGGMYMRRKAKRIQ